MVVTRLARTLLVIAAVIGIGAALLGGYHGYGEFLQGDAMPPGVLINAFDATNCPVDMPGGGCFPAMTILPLNFGVIGMITIIIAGVTLFAAVTTLRGRDRGLGLVLTSIPLLLVGGGFLAPILGFVGAGIAAIGSRKRK